MRSLIHARVRDWRSNVRESREGAETEARMSSMSSIMSWWGGVVSAVGGIGSGSCELRDAI